jgi:hypothetical protein
MSIATTAISADEARALLSATLAAPWPGGRAAFKAVGNAVLSLDQALTDLEAITEGIHWSAVYPELDGPEPEADARRIAADDVTGAAEGLRKVLDERGMTI